MTGHSFGLYTSHLGRCPDASGSVDGPGRTTEAVGRFGTEPHRPWMASIGWMRASKWTDRMPGPDGPGLFIGWLNSPWNSKQPRTCISPTRIGG